MTCHQASTVANDTSLLGRKGTALP